MDFKFGVIIALCILVLVLFHLHTEQGRLIDRLIALSSSSAALHGRTNEAMCAMDSTLTTLTRVVDGCKRVWGGYTYFPESDNFWTIKHDTTTYVREKGDTGRVEIIKRDTLIMGLYRDGRLGLTQISKPDVRTP